MSPELRRVRAGLLWSLKANGAVMLFIGLRELAFREIELGGQAPGIFATGVAACTIASILAGVVAGLVRPRLGSKGARLLLGALIGFVYGIGMSLFALDPGDSIVGNLGLFMVTVPMATVIFSAILYGLTIGRETAWPMCEPWA